MKVWVTKHALSRGITEEEAERVENSPYRSIKLLHPRWIWNPYLSGKEWHETREEALAHAEEMRVKAIKLNERRLANLKALKFT